MHADAQAIAADDFHIAHAAKVAALSAAMPVNPRRKLGADMRTPTAIRAARGIFPKPRRVPVPNGQGVRRPCVVAGVRYPSIKAASRATGIHFATIRGRMDGSLAKWAAWDVNVATTG